MSTVSTRDSDVPVTNPLRELLKRSCVNLAERVATLCDLLSSLSEATDPAAQLNECRDLSHQIAGAAGSVGFDRLGESAAMLDRKLVEAIAGDQPVREAQGGEVPALCAELTRLVGDMRPEQSRLYDADLTAGSPPASC